MVFAILSILLLFVNTEETTELFSCDFDDGWCGINYYARTCSNCLPWSRSSFDIHGVNSTVQYDSSNYFAYIENQEIVGSLVARMSIKASITDWVHACVRLEYSIVGSQTYVDVGSFNGDTHNKRLHSRNGWGVVYYNYSPYTLDNNVLGLTVHTGVSKGFVAIDNVNIRNESCIEAKKCIGESYNGLGRHTFPDAYVGETVTSFETCGDNKLNYFLNLANRTCAGDILNNGYWRPPEYLDCGPEVPADSRATQQAITIKTMETVSRRTVHETTEQSEGKCHGGSYKEKYTFPDAYLGETVTSMETCGGSKVNYFLNLANRTCAGDHSSDAHWEIPMESNCGPDITAEYQLERIAKIEVTADNVETITIGVQEITEQSHDITADALETTLEILQDIILIGSNSTKVTESLVEIVDNLFDVEEDVLFESQVENQVLTSILRFLEEQLNLVELDETGVFEEVSDNVAVSVQSFETEISQNNVSYITFVSESTRDGLGGIEYSYDDEHIADAVNVSIRLSANISKVVNMTDFRIVVVVYINSKLFQTTQFINSCSGRRSNSHVISFSIPGVEGVVLDEPTLITFTPTEVSKTNKNTTCVFWDFDLKNGTGGWSTDGCRFTKGSADGSDRQYCECDHLTNFAILMDFYGINNADLHAEATEIITTVGLSLSIVCLCLTLLTFLSNRNFRICKPKKIQCQLCLSLLGLYIVFLLGIDKAAKPKFMRENCEDALKADNIWCIVVGALLQYFLLSSVFWMTVQAVHMYYLFVKVVGHNVTHLLLKACLFAWGVPLAIVASTLFYDTDHYVDSKAHCFLIRERMYHGVAIPVGISLVFNTGIFITVLYKLARVGKTTNTSSKLAKKNKTNIKQMLQNGVTIATVLGLTWSVGFFAIGDASRVVVWIFCILNSLQGFIIFLMFCIRNKEVRVHWSKMLHALLPTYSVSANTSQANSISGKV